MRARPAIDALHASRAAALADRLRLAHAILLETARVHGVDVAAIKAGKRDRETSAARAAAVRRMWAATGLNFTQIGLVCDLDPSSVRTIVVGRKPAKPRAGTPGLRFHDHPLDRQVRARVEAGIRPPKAEVRR